MDDSGSHLRIFLQPVRDDGFEGIELAISLAFGHSLRGRIEILPDRPPTHVEMALDLADRPVLRPVQTVQVVDLFARQHDFWEGCRFAATA